MPKTLTIRSFLPDREIAICQRLRELRLKLNVEQAIFAEQFGISRSRLSSYEYAKAPIRYELGKEICFRCNVSQRWLATGAEPQIPYLDVSPHLEYQIKPKTLFSAAFDNVLEPVIAERECELKRLVGDEAFRSGNYEPAILDSLSLVGELPSRAVAFHVEKVVNLWLNWLPPDLQIEYGKILLKANEEFRKKFGREIAKAKPPVEREEKVISEKSLTVGSLKSKSESMKSEMQKLIEKVKNKASRPGGKSQLANELGVAPARVSEWLSGKKEPGGEYTLRLLKWVES